MEANVNIEEECCACGDPDYGVFGDQTSCQCPCHHPAIYEPNPRQEADVTRQRERQERIARTSREFNSSLIQNWKPDENKTRVKNFNSTGKRTLPLCDPFATTGKKPLPAPPANFTMTGGERER